MTSNAELLPLPPKQVLDLHISSGVRFYGHSNESMQDYARANMDPLIAEIERLRAELDRLRGEHVRVRRDRNAAEARADRLAEALREAQKLFEWNAIGGPLRRRIDALLRDHDKEN